MPVPGFSMGYNSNGKLRSAEVLLKPDGSFQKIRQPRPGRLLCHLRLYAVLQKIIAKQKQMYRNGYICFCIFCFRQYRIILSADTSEVRQMLSQKRR